MQPPAALPFFTDQNVADSAGNALVAAGHTLVRLRDCMATDSPDDLVAATCLRSGHILVSHDTDFKGLAKRLEITQKQYLSKFHRVDLRCFEPDAAVRLAAALPVIELEWRLTAVTGRQMVIEIRPNNILIRR